ncbi:MAG: type IX secretion system membrane protein PorP/SprF [Flavobacteriales bacterium]|nr:type IX secretion system membrane protein PorP/SprF [Flavobacteriales bacterium]
MRRLVIVFSIFMCIADLNAQQLPQYTQFLMNDAVYNPGIVGTRDAFRAKLNHREQWVGIKDAPRTNIITVEGPILDHKMGIGAFVYSDVNGPTRQIGFKGAYSYHLELADEMELSFGLSAGFVRYAIDGSKITSRGEEIELNDPVINTGFRSKILPDAGFGTYIHRKDFFAGISVPQLLNTRVKLFDADVEALGRLVNHYYVIGGYNYELNDDFTLTPAVLVKYVSPVPVQIEAAFQASFQNMVTAAVSYRTEDAFSVMLRYNLQDHLSVGYSYDFIMSDLNQYASGSHEIMIGARFKDTKED